MDNIINTKLIQSTKLMNGEPIKQSINIHLYIWILTFTKSTIVGLIEKWKMKKDGYIF